MAYKVAQKDEAIRLLHSAVDEYTRANSIKPDDEGVMMQLARADSALGEYAKAEELYKAGHREE